MTIATWGVPSIQMILTLQLPETYREGIIKGKVCHLHTLKLFQTSTKVFFFLLHTHTHTHTDILKNVGNQTVDETVDGPH